MEFRAKFISNFCASDLEEKKRELLVIDESISYHYRRMSFNCYWVADIILFHYFIIFDVCVTTFLVRYW